MNINRRCNGWNLVRAYGDGLHAQEDYRREKRAR